MIFFKPGNVKSVQLYLSLNTFKSFVLYERRQVGDTYSWSFSLRCNAGYYRSIHIAIVFEPHAVHHHTKIQLKKEVICMMISIDLVILFITLLLCGFS